MFTITKQASLSSDISESGDRTTGQVQRAWDAALAIADAAMQADLRGARERARILWNNFYVARARAFRMEASTLRRARRFGRAVARDYDARTAIARSFN